MDDGGNPIFDEVARIEREADEITATARAKADDIRRKAEEEAKTLAETTDREIEQAASRLADEYKARTDQALTQIDVDFLKAEEDLEVVRERRLDELVERARSGIRRALLGTESTDSE